MAFAEEGKKIGSSVSQTIVRYRVVSHYSGYDWKHKLHEHFTNIVHKWDVKAATVEAQAFTTKVTRKASLPPFDALSKPNR